MHVCVRVIGTCVRARESYVCACACVYVYECVYVCVCVCVCVRVEYVCVYTFLRRVHSVGTGRTCSLIIECVLLFTGGYCLVWYMLGLID